MSSSHDSAPVTSDGGGSDAAAQDAAKAKREARKARILGAGSDRLARITKTGRGGEADTLYATPPKPLGGASSSSTAAARNVDVDEDEVLARANAALRGSVGQKDDDDPQDVDISQGAASAGTGSMDAGSNPFLAMMGGGAGGNGSGAGMPQDLQGMMRAMQEAMMGGGGGGMGGAAPGTDGTAKQGFPGGASPFPFGPGAATAVEPAGPSLVDAVFNFMRAAVFVIFGVALAYGALRSGHADALQSVPEKASEQVIDQFAHMTRLHRWARLAYERPAHWEARYFGVESFGLPIQGIPVFWLFITLEIGLSSMRIMLQRRRPAPPGLLLKVAAFIPNAKIQFAIRALAAYLPLLDAFVNDLAIVIFMMGCAILFAAWRVGLDPLAGPSDGSVNGADLASGFHKLSQAAQGVVTHVSDPNAVGFDAAVGQAPPM